jgi:hypothetical protein
LEVVLGWLAEISRDTPGARGAEIRRWLDWLCARACQGSGRTYASILADAYELADAGARLLNDDGGLARPVPGYAEAAGPLLGQRDLTDSLAAYRQMDRDGRTARLLEQMRQEWPFFDEAMRALASRGIGAPAGKPSALAAPLAPEAKASDGAGPRSKEPPADGTVKNARIWLKGKPYPFTPGLRDLLSYLLATPGVSEEAVIKDFGMTDSAHLQKRLTDLRAKLAVELKKSGWRLQIKTEETCISCKWEEAK